MKYLIKTSRKFAAHCDTAHLMLLAGLLLLGTGGTKAAHSATTATKSAQARETNLNTGWRFLRIDNPAFTPPDLSAPAADDSAWETVALPHTPRIEPLVANSQWQGLCWYRRHLTMSPAWQGRKVVLDFGGAMSVADVWVNGRQAATHNGGYLPFSVDLTSELHPGDNVIAVRLDNRDNPEVPPGKPYKSLDFDWYGGLYRDVSLRITDRVHITDAVQADKPASGGVFVTYPEATPQRATVAVRLHVLNEQADARTCRADFSLLGANGQVAATASSPAVSLPPGADYVFTSRLLLAHPQLWDPGHPSLYRLQSVVYDGARPADAIETPVGIRRISWSASGGFQINGTRMYLRGTNRHQEYPYLGYAVSDSAQYRDALKIKNAGFDFVRLSHYPQSPAFLDACDALGLVVIEPIPGWQFIGDDVFQQRSLQNERDMIRRDRNHPCIALWETSLNETRMPKAFMDQLQSTAHEEYPGDQCFTAGWMDDFDVFLQSRQAGGCHNYKNGDKACLVSEYGDWEYYAKNSGLDQPAMKNLTGKERSSRQSRADGEQRLLQQMLNFQEAANDNRSTPAAGDASWLMYDYSRGYAPDLETSGAMDSLRLPKFSYDFFQSQRDADAPHIAGAQSGPLVRVASYWNASSLTTVWVLSNCEEVALYRDGKLIARQKPDTDANSTRLPHPPFTFHLAPFTPGVLKAVGYIGGVARATDTVRTPGAPAKIRLRADFSGRALRADGADAVFVYADIVDAQGTVVTDAALPVTFTVTGSARLISDDPAPLSAGTAAILVQAGQKPGPIAVHATAKGLPSAELTISSQ